MYKALGRIRVGTATGRAPAEGRRSIGRHTVPFDFLCKEDIIGVTMNTEGWPHMPFTLNLSKALCQAGWKVKIYDAEGPEEPHVTIYRKSRTWRLSLRTGRFLDEGDKWSQIDKGVRMRIENKKNWKTLQAQWDRLHGKHNPISSEEDNNDNKD
jgi:hypothetical protein